MITVLLLAALITPVDGAGLVEAIESAKRNPGPDTIQLTPGVIYTVPVHPAYRVALRLDGLTDGLKILTVGLPAATIVLEAFPANGLPVVLFGCGRVAACRDVVIESVILDGSDSEIVDEDRQQSTLFRAFAIEDLTLRDVVLRNIAADGIKLAGSAKLGPTRRVFLDRVRSHDTGRAAVVIQSLVEDVRIWDLRTRRQRKGAIDIEATMSGQPGPRRITIQGSDLDTTDTDVVPPYGLSLGGDESVEVAVVDTRVEGGIVAHNARATFSGVTADSWLLRKSSDVWVTDSVVPSLESTHHQSKGPRARFLRTKFGKRLVLKSPLEHEFLDCDFAPGSELMVVNEARGVDVPAVVFRGERPKLKLDRRSWSRLDDPREVE